MNIAELPTPALLLDVDLFDANVGRMAEIAQSARKQLRPHFKAHKSVDIARRQMAAGAVGVCAATVREAEILVGAGIQSVLLTSPIADFLKCSRIAALAPHVSVVVDHAAQVGMYDAAGGPLNVLVDLDIGDHRTGIAPGDAALALARDIAARKNLSFAGLQAYSVRASHMSAEEDRDGYYAGAMNAALRTKELIEADGIACPVITGGSSGSYPGDVTLPYVTELQAGSYALMDVAYARIGVDFANALTVLSTVISANHADRVTVDSGFKAFATDRPFGPDVMGLNGGRYGWAGDEFGYVFLDRSSHNVDVGDRVRFIPPHCDPTVNLYDRIHVCRGDEVLEIWSVMDRYHAR